MLQIAVTQDGFTQTAVILPENGPALRSAIAEIRNELGGRLSGSHRFPKEAALTRAVSALGALAAAINAVIPEEDADYE